MTIEDQKSIIENYVQSEKILREENNRLKQYIYTLQAKISSTKGHEGECQSCLELYKQIKQLEYTVNMLYTYNLQLSKPTEATLPGQYPQGAAQPPAHTGQKSMVPDYNKSKQAYIEGYLASQTYNVASDAMLAQASQLNPKQLLRYDEKPDTVTYTQYEYIPNIRKFAKRGTTFQQVQESKMDL